MIHLDTSFLIHALARDSAADRQLRQWLRDGVPLAVSAIVWAEFLCGPVSERDIELAGHVVPTRAPFLPEDAALAARLFNLGGRRRGSLTDCMIAATAIRLGAALATANAADFAKLAPAGLRTLAGS